MEGEFTGHYTLSPRVRSKRPWPAASWDPQEAGEGVVRVTRIITRLSRSVSDGYAVRRRSALSRVFSVEMCFSIVDSDVLSRGGCCSRAKGIASELETEGRDSTLVPLGIWLVDGQELLAESASQSAGARIIAATLLLESRHIRINGSECSISLLRGDEGRSETITC